MARIASRIARRSTETAPAVVPTKQLSVSTFRNASAGIPNVLSVEIGDHVAYFSGGAGKGHVYATTDGKKIVRRQTPGHGLRGIRDLGDELWITGEYGTLAVSTDRAGSWTTVETPNNVCLWDIVRDAKGAFWIGGSSNTILKSTKRGAPFKAVTHELTGRDERADPRVELVPAGVMFPLFNAYWDGKAFVKPKGLKGPMSALAIAPSGTIVIVGDNGAAFRSTDGGASYKPVTTGVKVHLEDVAVVAGGFVIVGDKGTMRRSEDDGATWKPLASGVTQHLWSIGSWGAGAFVGGDDGLLLRIEAPGDTYWKGRTDDFASKPIVPAAITALSGPSDAERDARFAKLFAEAEAAHAAYAKKLASPRHPADEHVGRILTTLDDVEEYKVLGDVLQSAGDPRGELIALQAAGQTRAATKYLKQHRAALLGALADIDENALKLEWRNGFVHGAYVAAYDLENVDEELEGQFVQWIATLLDEPAARFLQQLTVGLVQPENNDYGNVMREIGRRARPALRTLYLGEFNFEETEISWSNLGDATQLCGACDRLERLTLRSGSMNLGKPGQLVFPRLRELAIITGGLTRDNLEAIAGAHLPSLESLTVYFGTERYGCNVQRKDLTALLDGTRFPRLRKLGLVNSEFVDELCSVLHMSPLVAQIAELDLSKGTLSDLGVRALATYARGLAHLEKLDISESFVTPSTIKMLGKVLPNTKITSSHQRGGEFDHRYVLVGE